MNPLEQLFQMMRQTSVPLPNWQHNQLTAGAQQSSGMGSGPLETSPVASGTPLPWKKIQGNQRNVLLNAIPFFGAGNQPSWQELAGTDRQNYYSPAGSGQERVIQLPNFPTPGAQQLDRSENYRSVNP